MMRGVFLALVVSVVALSAAAIETEVAVVGLPLKNLDKLESLFWRVADPDHPTEYLQHRNVDQLADLTGASDQDIQDATQWLLSQGATDITVSSLRDTVTGTIKKSLRIAKPANADFVLYRSSQQHDVTPRQKLPVSNDGQECPFCNGGVYSMKAQKQAYGIPTTLRATNNATRQMVWGPGTFGYSLPWLEQFRAEQCPLLNMDKVVFGTENHGVSGGDNFGEGNLDTMMTSCMGLNVETIVENTNASSSTEEGKGFGLALLDFLTDLSSRPADRMPQILSISLGSLSSHSCNLLCSEAQKQGYSLETCNAYLQQQRQVCMYLSDKQTDRISTALQVLGLRGVTVFGSAGDGGSHFSFEPFQEDPFRPGLANVLNEISCAHSMPVFPTSSPYIVSVGGTQWANADSTQPEAWVGGGGGFSGVFPMPQHQKQAVNSYLSNTAGLPSAGSFNRSNRAYPDIASVAIHGTSQSSPATAGMWSLLMDARLNQGLPPLGFVAPRIWKVAQQYPGAAFEDVTVGNSRFPCQGAPCAEGFPATKGWDPITGWGRPVWKGLMQHFAQD